MFFGFLSCKKKTEAPSEAALNAGFTMLATDKATFQITGYIPDYAYTLGWKDESLENDTAYGDVFFNALGEADTYEWTLTQNVPDKIDCVQKFYTKSFYHAYLCSTDMVTVTLKVTKNNSTGGLNSAPMVASSSKKFFLPPKKIGYPAPDSTMCPLNPFNGRYKGVFSDKQTDTLIVEFKNCEPSKFKHVLITSFPKQRFFAITGLTDTCLLSPLAHDFIADDLVIYTKDQIYIQDAMYNQCFYIRTYMTFADVERNLLKAVVSYSSYDDTYNQNRTSVIKTFIGKRL